MRGFEGRDYKNCCLHPACDAVESGRSVPISGGDLLPP